MRTLHADLTAAQKAVNPKPLYKIQLTQGANDYTYTETRIKYISHTEEPNSQEAEVFLNNSDGTLTSIDFKGYKGVISYGATTVSGDRFSACAPLWVTKSELQSAEGVLLLKLSLIGIPNRLAKDKASAAFILQSDDKQTTKDLLTQVVKAVLPARVNGSTYALDDLVIAATTNSYVYKCTTAGTAAGSAPTWSTTIGNTVTDSSVVWTNQGREITIYSHCAAYTATFDSEDGLLDSFAPKEAFALVLNQSRMSAIEDLLKYTKDTFRSEDDGEVHFFQPTVSGTVYNYEYSMAASEHTFFDKSYTNRLVIPNYISVSSIDDADGYTGYAEDTDSSALLPVREHYKLRLASTLQATTLADAILEQYKLAASQGGGDVPLNVGQEAYDYVKITDTRENDNRIGNILYIKREAGGGTWNMTINFGIGWRGMRSIPYSVLLDALEKFYADLEEQQKIKKNKTTIWQKIFDGSTDTPSTVPWGFESPLPFTFTSQVYFTPIVADVVYVIDRAQNFWKYNMATWAWTKLAGPAYTGENCYRTLALSPNGSTIACVSEGAASEPAGRRIEFYAISTNTWSASSQAPNVDGATSNLQAVVWEDNDILWAWAKKSATLNGKCIKYVKSTDTFSQYTNLTTAQTAWQGRCAAQKSDSTVVYGGTIGGAVNSYFKYTVATDAYAAGTATASSFFMFTYDKDKLWYADNTNVTQGYVLVSDDSNNPNYYAANTARTSGYHINLGIGDDLADIIALSRNSSPHLMSIRDGGTYILGTQVFGALEQVAVLKPDDNYPVFAVLTGKAYAIPIERTGTLNLPAGTWRFYYSVLGDYTQVQIYRGVEL